MLSRTRIGWFLAITCVIAAGVFYVHESGNQAQPPFVIEPTEVALDGIAVGTHEVVIRFHNPGTVARRIIGLEEA